MTLNLAVFKVLKLRMDLLQYLQTSNPAIETINAVLGEEEFDPRYAEPPTRSVLIER